MQWPKLLVYQDLKLFDEAQFGVIRTDLMGRITYANRWMKNLVGDPLAEGSRLFDFVSDAQSHETLEQELRKRIEGHSGEYVIALRNRGRRPVQVQVFGTPLRSEAEHVTGAVAFVTHAPLDPLRNAILSIGVSKVSPTSSLAQLHEILGRYYPFDSFVVSIYDPQMQYTRTLYTHIADAPAAGVRWNKHWVRLTAMQSEWIRASTVRDMFVDDFAEFLQRAEWRSMADDPMAVAMQAFGIRSIAGVAIKEGPRIVASVSLLSKTPAAYDEDVVRELHELPIDRVVLATLNALREGEDAFHADLLRRMSHCEQIDELSNIVVGQLQRYHRLARVHLYSVNWVANEARLSSFCAGGRLKRYSPEPTVALSGGLIAEVAKSGDAAYVADLSKDSHTSGLLVLKQGSAFCWPVRYHREGKSGVARWLFVAADQNTDAFSPKERDALMRVAVDIGGLLERLTELHFMRATFLTASDAILVVDELNRVRRANPAAAALFGRADQKQIAGPAKALFRDTAAADEFLRKPAATAELEVVDAASNAIPTLVNSRALPDKIGGKVIAFEDLRTLRRLEELSFLGRVAAAISVQIQTPLTLAGSWVQRIRLQLAPPADQDKDSVRLTVDLADQTLLQLRRIQACLDRIALYDADGKFEPGPVHPVSLAEELQRLGMMMPDAERGLIRVRPPEQKIVVGIYPEHLHFVLETLVSFFMRKLPETGSLIVAAGSTDGSGWVDCQLDEVAAMAATSAPRSSLATELGLVERGLKQILEVYRGGFTSNYFGANLVSARLSIPLYRAV